jgi:HAD superfamily hydrolase (TIGR01509 family)
MPRSFDVLVFDLGNVIVPFDNDVLHARLAGRCTAPDASERLSRLAHDRRYGTGEKSIRELHQALVGEVGYQGDWPTFVDDWTCHLTLDADMLALVEQLAERHRVMIFSNINQQHWDRALEMSEGRVGKFEAYLSHEIGDCKPAVSSFLTVARLAKIDPARAIFFDDMPDNVAAARKVGFQAEVFTTQAALEDYLRAAGAI